MLSALQETQTSAAAGSEIDQPSKPGHQLAVHCVRQDVGDAALNVALAQVCATMGIIECRRSSADRIGVFHLPSQKLQCWHAYDKKLFVAFIYCGVLNPFEASISLMISASLMRL